jgi:hypothetical protein
MSSRYAQGATSLANPTSIGLVATPRVGSTLVAVLGVSSTGLESVATTANGSPIAPLFRIAIDGTHFAEVYKLENCDGSAVTWDSEFTMEGDPASVARASFLVEEVAEVVPAGVDRYSAATGTGTSPDSGSALATSQAAEMLLGFVMTIGPDSDAAPTWTSPYAAGQRTGLSSGAATNNITLASAFAAVAAIGAYSASATLGTSRAWACIIVTLKDSAVANKSKITYQLALGDQAVKLATGMPEARAALAGPVAVAVTIGEE